jgi:MFS family permease
LLGFFFALGNGMINVFIQPYLKHIGLSPQEVGLLQLASSIALSASLIPAAFLADKFGRKKIALSSLVPILPGFLIVLYAPGFNYMLVGFVLIGIGNAIAGVTLNPLIADVTPRDKLDLVGSLSQILWLAGASIGMALSWVPQLIANSHSLLDAYRTFMLYGGIIAATSFLLLLPVRDNVKPSEKFVLGFSRETIIFTVLSAITGLGAGASIQLINYYFMTKFGVEAGELGTRMLVETLLMIPFTSLAPIISSRLGTLKAVVALQLASIPLLVATAQAPSFLTAAAFFTLRTVLMNAANPLFWSLTMKIIGPEERSRYTMLNILAWQVASGTGSAIGGTLMNINLDSPLYLTASIYLVQTALLFTLLKKLDKN